MNSEINFSINGKWIGNSEFITDSGTSNYLDLTNKPSINNTTLTGNKTLDELGIASKNYVDNMSLKTINGQSIKGEGNITIEGGGVATNAYTKTETDTALALKADKTTVYTKTEVDTALSSKADSTDIPDVSGLASKSYVDNMELKTINGQSIKGTGDITISGGSGGTTDYAALSNKPSINGVTLEGNKTTDDLGLGVSDTQISDAVDAYLTENPVSGVTTEDVTNAVNAYLTSHPDQFKGDKGDTGDTGEQGPQGEPGSSGVVVSESVPTDPNAKVWINPNGIARPGDVYTKAQADAKFALLEELNSLIARVTALEGGSSGGGTTPSEPTDELIIGFIGDSVTYGLGSEVCGAICDNGTSGEMYSFPEYIKEQFPSAKVYNGGYSGWTITKIGDATNHLYDKPLDLTSWGDADYIFLSGGINDSSKTITEGALSTDGTYDVTTFIGALEQYVVNAKTTFPNAKIIFLNTHTAATEVGRTVHGYNLGDDIVAVCQKWNIPLLDTHTTNTISDMPTHPTKAQYLLTYCPTIKTFLTKVMNNSIQPTYQSGKYTAYITNSADTMEISVGGNVDMSGITTTAYYTNATSANVSALRNVDTSAVITSTEGTYNVSVEYDGKVKLISVTVNAVASGFTIPTLPDDSTNYVVYQNSTDENTYYLVASVSAMTLSTSSGAYVFQGSTKYYGYVSTDGGRNWTNTNSGFATSTAKSDRSSLMGSYTFTTSTATLYDDSHIA